MQHLWFAHECIQQIAENIREYIYHLNVLYSCDNCHREFEYPLEKDQNNPNDPFLYVNLQKHKDVSYIYTSQKSVVVRSAPGPDPFEEEEEERIERMNMSDIYGVKYKNRTYCIHCYKNHEYDNSEKTKEYKKEK